MTKILLVEDDKSLREIYGVRLLAEGYDIVSAGDGEEALAMAIKERPSLILSDVMMPKISGFDMLDILRSTTETKDVKVIIMTALSSEDQRKRGEQLGADRYLVKSQVGIEDVVRTVHEVLSDIPGVGTTPVPTATTPQETPIQTSVAMPQQPTAAPAPQTTTVRPDVASLSPQAQSLNPLTQAPQTPPQQPHSALPQPGQIPQNQQPSPLPQPVAPFSSSASRPNSLGERVIHPLESIADNSAEIRQMMDAALSDSVNTPQPAPQNIDPQDIQPQSQSIQQPQVTPQPQVQPQPIQQPQVTPQSQPIPQQPATPPTPQPIDSNPIQNAQQ